MSALSLSPNQLPRATYAYVLWFSTNDHIGVATMVSGVAMTSLEKLHVMKLPNWNCELLQDAVLCKMTHWQNLLWQDQSWLARLVHIQEQNRRQDSNRLSHSTVWSSHKSWRGVDDGGSTHTLLDGGAVFDGCGQLSQSHLWSQSHCGHCCKEFESLWHDKSQLARLTLRHEKSQLGWADSGCPTWFLSCVKMPSNTGQKNTRIIASYLWQMAHRQAAFLHSKKASVDMQPLECMSNYMYPNFRCPMSGIQIVRTDGTVAEWSKAVESGYRGKSRYWSIYS